MTPQDAQIIRSVFDRLKTMEAAPRDEEAEGLVEALLKADPQAGLALVRAVVLTERAREAAANEVEALRERVEALEAEGPAARRAPESGGLFGGAWGRPPATQEPAPRQDGPWSGRAPQQPGPWDRPQAQGGGFWGSALRTGAGVAGGLFAFEALKGLFGGGHAVAAPGGEADKGAGLFDQPGKGDDANLDVASNPGTPDDRLQSAAWDPGTEDEPMDDDMDFGGDDDSWA